jgi:(2Fe-2S) ferredoxin
MAKEDRKDKSLEEITRIVGIGSTETHLFLCTGPDCCTPEEGMAAWQAVKRAVKDHNPDLRAARLYRTRVNCLRICKGGPIAVAYPQGKWFHSVTEAAAPGLVEYLQTGATHRHPLEFAAHPLPAEPQPGEEAAD